MKTHSISPIGAVLVAAITTILVVLVIAGPFRVLGTVDDALQYLAEQEVSSWIVMAQAGEDPLFIHELTYTSAVDLEAPILALTASGINPRTYSEIDLVEELLSYHKTGQIGDPDLLNDDFFGVLALVSVGFTNLDVEVSDSIAYIVSHQNSDGGWSYAVGGESDTNSTAAAIQALVAGGVEATDPVIEGALSYLKSAQNTDGGFPYMPDSPYGTDSDGASDAWVIMALNALGADPESWITEGGDPVVHLQSLQTDTGAFLYQKDSSEDGFTPTLTAYAVIALSNRSLPVGIMETKQPSVLVSYRVEGSDQTLCSGEVFVETVLETIEHASEECSLPYTIVDSAYGKYVSQIGDDKAEGVLGWMYSVNYESPSVGANEYMPSDGDEVLWYFGEFGMAPIRMGLSSQRVDAGSDVTVIVEYLASDEWEPLGGASVTANDLLFTTDSDGVVHISLPNGIYQTQTSKEGFIRSDVEYLMVGATANSSINLSAEVAALSGGVVDGGQGEISDTVSLIVSPESIDFGVLHAGDVGHENVVLQNSGTASLTVGSEVTGDRLFRDNLSLDSVSWRSFHIPLPPEVTHDTDVSVVVPENYDEGFANGSLIFWAIPS